MKWLGDFRRYLLNLLIVGLILASLVSALWLARAVGLSHSEPSARARYHALPVAISQVYHGRPHDYTGYWSIAMRFHNGLPLIPIMEQSVNATVPVNDRTYYWTADDRGYSDFIAIAFTLLGPTVPALFYFWFLLLLGTLGVAVLRFRRDRTALVWVCGTVIAIGTTLPALTRAYGTTFADVTVHLTELKMFDVLACVSFMHLLLAMCRPAPEGSRLLDSALILIQTAFIALLIHARQSVSWMFLALLVIGGCLMLSLWIGRRRVAVQPILCVLACVGLTYGGIHVYHRIAFNEAYRGEIGPRTIWHNILMGLEASPSFAEKLALPRVDDRAAVEAVLRDMRSRGDSRLDARWDAQAILNSLGSHNTFDWVSYEDAARRLVLTTLMADPVATLKLYVVDKPLGILKVVACGFVPIRSDCAGIAETVPAFAAGGRPGGWMAHLPLFLCAAALIGIAGIGRRPGSTHDEKAMTSFLPPAVGIAVLVALSPSVVVYPGVLQLGGAFCLSLTLVLMLLARMAEGVRLR